jgi:hypothetical protein
MRKAGQSPRFLRFVNIYAANGRNAYRAALAAGYSVAMAKGRSYELARLARQFLGYGQIAPSGRGTAKTCAAYRSRGARRRTIR